MKDIRPFHLIVLAVFGLSALIGLVFFASYSGGGGKGGEDQVGTVSIWGTLPRAGVEAGLTALRQSSKAYGDVSYRQVPAGSYSSALADAIASGAGPDLILLTQEELMSERGKLTLIPSATISERTFVDAYLPIGELFLTEGGTYGIPYVVDPLVLYYNRSIFASEGVATPPSTWEAVTGLAPRVTELTESQTVLRSLAALGEYANVSNARAILSLLFLQAGNPITESTAQGVRATLTDRAGEDAAGVSAAEAAVNFYAQFANPAKVVYSWNRSLPPSREFFLSGDLALYFGYASEQPSLAAGNPNLDFDMAKVPVPGTSGARSTYALAYAFAIPKASKNPSGALTAAIALTGADALPPAARALSMAPGKRAFLSPATDDLYGPVFYPEALAAKGWLSPDPSVTDAIFSGMITNVLAGRADAESALSAAANSLNASLR